MLILSKVKQPCITYIVCSTEYTPFIHCSKVRCSSRIEMQIVLELAGGQMVAESEAGSYTSKYRLSVYWHNSRRSQGITY